VGYEKLGDVQLRQGDMAGALSPQRIKPITGGNRQINQSISQVHLLKLTCSPFGNIRRKPLRFAPGIQLLGTPIRECSDHAILSIFRRGKGGRWRRTVNRKPASVNGYRCNSQKISVRIIARTYPQPITPFSDSSPASHTL